VQIAHNVQIDQHTAIAAKRQSLEVSELAKTVLSVVAVQLQGI